MKKRLSVVKESKTGRNEEYLDNKLGIVIKRGKLVKMIKAGNYPGYHVMKLNGVDTPRSNPDKSKDNNLG